MAKDNSFLAKMSVSGCKNVDSHDIAIAILRSKVHKPVGNGSVHPLTNYWDLPSCPCAFAPHHQILSHHQALGFETANPSKSHELQYHHC